MTNGSIAKVDFLVLVLLSAAWHCWLLSSQKILFSWPLISHLQPLWQILLHRLLFFFLSLKCWSSSGFHLFSSYSFLYVFFSQASYCIHITLVTIWILVNHKYVSLTQTSLLPFWIIHWTSSLEKNHKYPKLNVSKITYHLPILPTKSIPLSVFSISVNLTNCLSQNLSFILESTLFPTIPPHKLSASPTDSTS